MSKKGTSLQGFNPSTPGNPKQSLISVARKVSRHVGITKPSQKFDKKTNIHFAWVPASKLFINYGRQRFPEPKHIKKLCTKWNILCVTPLQARYSKKEDRYYISDGQQHGIGWVLTYGEDSVLPVFYVETEDEAVETIQLLALNCDNERMAPYFIHKQKIVQGDKESIDLENAVTASGATIEYNKRGAGTITNMGHLFKARDNFELSDITDVLTRMLQTWPTKRVQTDVLRGLLNIQKCMREQKTYKESTFDDIIYQSSQRYLDEKGVPCSAALFNAIQEQCRIDLETTSFDAESKVTTGVLSIYEQLTGKDVLKGHRPFKELTMPVIKEA